MKKALLITETAKIIIAVLCIVVLVILAVNLYGIFSSKIEIEQARAEIKQISWAIASLKEENSVSDYTIVAPLNWFVMPINDRICFWQGIQDEKKIIYPECEKGSYCICADSGKINIESSCWIQAPDSVNNWQRGNCFEMDKPREIRIIKIKDGVNIFLEKDIYNQDIAEKFFSYQKSESDETIKQLALHVSDTKKYSAEEREEIKNKLEESVTNFFNMNAINKYYVRIGRYRFNKEIQQNIDGSFPNYDGIQYYEKNEDKTDLIHLTGNPSEYYILFYAEK